MNIMDDETKRRHSKNFLGGLYPPVDKDMLPLYLRDTSDAGTDLSNKLDLIYLWHIPKVCVRSGVYCRVVSFSFFVVVVSWSNHIYILCAHSYRSFNSFHSFRPSSSRHPEAQ
jgi:hypothetical protein